MEVSAITNAITIITATVATVANVATIATTTMVITIIVITATIITANTTVFINREASFIIVAALFAQYYLQKCPKEAVNEKFITEAVDLNQLNQFELISQISQPEHFVDSMMLIIKSQIKEPLLQLS